MFEGRFALPWWQRTAQSVIIGYIDDIAYFRVHGFVVFSRQRTMFAQWSTAPFGRFKNWNDQVA